MITFKIRWFTLQDTNFVTKLAKNNNPELHSMILNRYIFVCPISYEVCIIKGFVNSRRSFPTTEIISYIPHQLELFQ